MKKIVSPESSFANGGVPVYIDDFLTIQDETSRYGKTFLKNISLNNNGIILDGMAISGVGPYTIADGYVYLDGEVRFFPSTNIAALTGYIVVDTDSVESRIFFDGATNPVITTKRAKWQAGAPAMGFDGISVATLSTPIIGNPFKLTEFTRGVPINGIIMWNYNSYLPLGFAVCDGSFGTPNLVNKFILGGSTAGATGGANSFTIATANLPSHSHTIVSDGNHNHTISSDGKHSHLIRSSNAASGPFGALTWTFAVEGPSIGGDEGYVWWGDDINNTHDETKNFISEVANHSHGGATGSTGSHTHGGATGNTGSGTAINFTPPYYQLIFIQRIA